MALFSLYHYMRNGHVPPFIQPHNWLFREGNGNFGSQLNANQNSDNFWDKRFECWTSDPLCGLDVAPKRPWEDLVEPEKKLFDCKGTQLRTSTSKPMGGEAFEHP
eukprot:CAMPEP_0170546458 /NCGR_PEP_ID=MMETSP0211-20121228/4816_1 /TAXON_ID=311385 /ORGANISM="Pseudokeronopsis sp., Strain OXSARD2" /LENGTH=104 /DNA_ID=CAMNT_0010850937 /DNA_START=149 /DNA_END=461 /DNA_ORIENTATION=+